jgi:hypothetical protein
MFRISLTNVKTYFDLRNTLNRVFHAKIAAKYSLSAFTCALCLLFLASTAQCLSSSVYSLSALCNSPVLA